MLRELRIRDVAIIEDVAVEFGPGLNVLSGETGAGKSIILGALGLILGARGSADMVRAGAESAEVQARVDLDPALIDALNQLDLPGATEDEGLLLRRIVMRNGRSRAYVGQSAVPIASLRRLAGLLVDYASQHEHQVLLDERRHAGILDRFGGLEAQVAALGESVELLRGKLAERSRLAQLEHEHRAREDYLRFQIEELDKLEPVAGEQESLASRRLQLRHAEELAQKARAADELLRAGGGSVLETLEHALRPLREINGIDPSLGEALEGLESALIQVEEASRDVSEYRGGLSADPLELEEVEDRLVALRQLARKHRCDVEDLPAAHERLRSELDELAGLEHRLSDLEPAIREARARSARLATALTRARAEAAKRLSSIVEGELGSLCMKGARFVPSLHALTSSDEGVGLGEDGGAPFATMEGAERVQFQLGANLGEDLKPLAKTASGGELSRILLALRRALAGTSPVQTCVFDEIDSGMGGETAEVVAQKLSSIAEEHQVLCITHLPQIAARADHHFRVEKSLAGGRTRTGVVALDAAEAVGELVRMIAGSSSTASAHDFAEDLLRRAKAERFDRMDPPSSRRKQE